MSLVALWATSLRVRPGSSRHITAPEECREKVLREIKRPVFSLLEHGPLYEKCTFLSYDAVKAIADIKFLAHMSDTILDEYEEGAEEE